MGLLCLLLRDLPGAASRLRVAHVNYGLRGRDSQRDQARVERICREKGLPFRLLRVRGLKGSLRKGKGSIQDLARTIRYGYFRDLVKKEKAWGVVVAHHSEDQAETVLDRLLRGGGARGLSGLRPVQSLALSAKGPPLRVWRPLLVFSKEQVRDFLREEGVPWREDRSNRGDLYRRNQIRHQVLPFLRRWNPGLSRNLARSAEVLRAEDEFLESLMPFLGRKLGSRRRAGSYRCQAAPFFRMPLALQRRWVRRVCEGFTVLARGLSYERVEGVLRTWRGEEKGPRDLGFGLSAGKEGPFLFLSYQRPFQRVSRK